MHNFRYWIIPLAGAVICCCMAVGVKADLIITSGTEETPYVISTAQDISQTGSPYMVRVGTSAGDGVARVDSGGSIFNSVSDGGYLTIGSSGVGLLTLNGGTLYSAIDPRLIRAGSGGTGRLIINSGTAYATFVQIGYGDAWGDVQVNGGTLNAGDRIRIGMLAGGGIGGGQLILAGGAINASNHVEIGYAGGTEPCTFEISGGTFTQQAGSSDIYVGTSSSQGTLHVNGSGATGITVADRIYGYAGRSTLKFTIDSGGVTPVSVNYTYSSLNGTVDMELAAGVTPEVDETFDLIVTRTGTMTSGLELAEEDEELWQLEVVGGTTLRARYLGPSGVEPPVADAGSDVAPEDADDDGFVTVTLDGTASTDDAGIVSYVWFDYDGAQIATGATANVSLPVGLNDITLVVTDGNSQTDTDVVRVWAYPKVDYWVDGATGDNGNPGTSEGQAWATIDYAMDNAGPGDVIMVKEGIYREAVTVGASGSPGAPITLMGKPFDRVVISGADEITGWTQCDLTTAKGNPDYASIYYADIAWEPKRLSQDGDTDLMLGRTPGSGWWKATAATSTTLTDTVNLTGADDAWNGGKICLNNSSVLTRSITDYVAATKTLTVDSSWAADPGDLYFLMGMVQLIDDAGQWAVEERGGGVWRVYCWPNGGGSPENYLMEGSRRGGYVVYFSRKSYLVFDNLEIRHGAVNGIGNDLSGGGNVIVRNCWVHHNDQYGIKASFSEGVQILRNLSHDNRWGISVAACNNAVVECNIIARNWEDGLRISGPGGELFAENPVMRSNCILGHILWNHADAFQTFSNVRGLLAERNLILSAGQGFFGGAREDTVLLNNMIIGSYGSLFSYGHYEVPDTIVLNNTMGFSGLSTVVHTSGSIGFDYANNIFYKGNSAPIWSNVVSDTDLVSDYNAFWHGPGLETSKAVVYDGNWYTLAQYQTASGQDGNSLYTDPLFVNAPAYHAALDFAIARLADFTPTRVYLTTTGNTGLFSVGDHIEIDWDGVVRTVTAVSTGEKYIEFTPALPTPVIKPTQVSNWLDKEDFALDLRPAENSPCIGGGQGGLDIGSDINVQQFLQGDFNGDGRRDLVWPPEE